VKKRRTAVKSNRRGNDSGQKCFPLHTPRRERTWAFISFVLLGGAHRFFHGGERELRGKRKGGVRLLGAEERVRYNFPPKLDYIIWAYYDHSTRPSSRGGEEFRKKGSAEEEDLFGERREGEPASLKNGFLHKSSTAGSSVCERDRSRKGGTYPQKKSFGRKPPVPEIT